MNKILYVIVFWLYFLFLEYVTKMISFDFKKHILKDKYMQNLKFSYNWTEKYAEAKALEKFKQMHTPEDIKN